MADQRNAPGEGHLPPSPRRSTFPAPAGWPTGSCAIMSAWHSRPTRRAGFTSSASTTKSASPSRSAFSPAPWVCGPTSSASSSRRSFRFGASRACFRCRTRARPGPPLCAARRPHHRRPRRPRHRRHGRRPHRVRQHAVLVPCHIEPHARASRLLEAALHLQARRRGPLPPQWPGHEGWGPRPRDR